MLVYVVLGVNESTAVIGKRSKKATAASRHVKAHHLKFLQTGTPPCLIPLDLLSSLSPPRPTLSILYSPPH